MDNKTQNLDFGSRDVERMREMLRQMSEFVAYFEVVQAKMLEGRNRIEEQIQTHQEQVNTQLKDIAHTVQALRECTSEMGIARLRQSMKDALAQGERHVSTLESTGEAQLAVLQKNTDEIKKLAKHSFDRLDKASSYVVKNIGDTLSATRLTDFKALTEESRATIEEISTTAITRIKKMAQTFQWKTMALISMVTLIVSLVVGLYLNDEMPWEIHNQVVVQRNAGQALINAWPSLSQAQKQHIMKHAKKAII